MKLLWEYSLPTTDASEDYQYESPILESGNFVYFVSASAGKPKLHILHKETGNGRELLLPKSITLIPSKYFFFSHNGTVILYTGDRKRQN